MESYIYIPEHHYEDAEIFSRDLRRLAQIIEGNETFYKREDEDFWNIGKGNDWWLYQKLINETTVVFVLSYRYARSKKWLDNVRDVIVWLLGIENFHNSKLKEIKSE